MYFMKLVIQVLDFHQSNSIDFLNSFQGIGCTKFTIQALDYVNVSELAQISYSLCYATSRTSQSMSKKLRRHWACVHQTLTQGKKL